MNKAGDLWYVHQFAKGELRVDGWKSQWRIDLERRMATEAPRTYAKRAMPIKVRLATKKPRPSRAKNPGFTSLGFPSGMTMSEYCKYRREYWRSRGLCGGCGAKASGGRASCALCLEKKSLYYYRKMGKIPNVKKIEPKFCKVCDKPLYSHNVLGFCRTHKKAREA